MEDIDKQDEGGWTQLHYEASHNNIDRVKLLLSLKANPNICSKGGNTPIDFAIVYGYNECLKILLRTLTKESLNKCNAFDKTPLDMAILNGRYHFFSIIYDAGGKTSFYNSNKGNLLIKLIQSRKNIKSVLVVFFALGKKTKRIHKDLISTIAKMIWETRDEEEWSLQHSKKRCV